MPSQLNGKQKRRATAPASTALPPQRYGGRRCSSKGGVSSGATDHWRRELPGRSPTSLRQPGYRPAKRAGIRSRLMSHASAGKRSQASSREPSSCHVQPEAPRLPPARRARALARIRRCAFAFLFIAVFDAAAADGALDQVVVTATREPRVDRPQQRRHRRHRQRRRSATRPPIRSRICCAARPACRSSRNGGPGQSSGYFIRGASTNSTVVLIDGVRVGSATLGQAEFEALSLAQIDHIEVLRGPASSLYGADAVGGVVQIFTRRGDGAPRVVGGAAIGGYDSRAATLGVERLRVARLRLRARRSAREKSRGVSAIAARATRSAPSTRTTTATGAKRAALRSATRRRPGHRIGLRLLETRLNVRSSTRPIRCRPTSRPMPRRISATT